MAKWTKNKVNPEQINNGNEYTINDNLSVESINAIINNSFKAQEDSEEALKKANSAYEANGTLVKINGENQTTWDATFSQKLYEESKNEFNINSKEIVWGEYWVDGTNKGRYANSFYSIQEIKPNTTYAISFKNEINPSRYAYNILDANKNPLSWKYDSSQRETKNWIFTTESNARYIVISQLDTSKENVGNLFIQLEKGNVVTSHEKYNPNRHITNREAEFLKEKFEKSKNLFNGDLQQGAYIYANGDYTYTTSYVCNAKPIPVQAGKQIKLSYISSGNVFASGFVFYKSGKFIGNATGDLATVPSDANQVCFNIESTDESPVSNYSNVQLEYGDVATPSQLYNSASHITNPQADLLKSEWEKQSNKLSYPYADTTKATSGMEFIDNGGGRLRVRGTATSNAVFYLKRGEFKLPKGTYTMSSNYYGEGIYIESNTGYFTFLELNKSKTTFTLTEDKTFNNLYLVVKAGYTIDITLELMLNEGTEEFPYQEWNGKIIHEKDIIGFEHVETIYNKYSTDSNINWGYTSGIPSNTYVDYDFSRYEKLRITVYRSNASAFTYEINLNQLDISGVYGGAGIHYSFQAQDNYFIYSSSMVSSNKNVLTHLKAGYTLDFFNTLVERDDVKIITVEGVY